jgi:hypothetical protein
VDISPSGFWQHSTALSERASHLSPVRPRWLACPNAPSAVSRPANNFLLAAPPASNL